VTGVRARKTDEDGKEARAMFLIGGLIDKYVRRWLARRQARATGR
jgi:hypothetical protein